MESKLAKLAEKAPQKTSSSDPDNTKSQQGQDPEKKQQDGDNQEEKKPAGGFDSTPIPQAPPGWTIKITFHRATNLPMADINTLSSDPYVLAQLTSSLAPRHKEDPFLRMRTPTIRKNTDPTWNTEWIIANVPSSGFKLKARVYDEDPADHDDRLGNVHVQVNSLSEGWEGINNRGYKIMKRSGSKRAYAVRAVAACFRQAKHLNGDLFLSIELLGRTKDQNGGRMYTVGPCWWTRHYSPMLGRLANLKDPDDDNDQGQSMKPKDEKRKAQKYNFQANQFQLQGPVPAELYHRYVEFKPFVKGMFTHSGLRGFVLSKALHHQHARVYNFDRDTVWGHFPQGPCEDMTKQFLDLVHHDAGGRIFTYVLTLDALFRFTETGKEFGVDMLSKHTMHSDVSIYIAFSGEFFIRRLKNPRKPPPPEPVEQTSQGHPSELGPDEQQNETHPPNDISGGPPDGEPPKDPAHYELIIDNDSGTYRPNAKLLPLLKEFLAASLPGLHIQVLDCQADQEKMEKWKGEQRDRKKKEGNQMVFAQGDHSSISSSDEEDLDAVEGGASGGKEGLSGMVGHDVAQRGHSKVAHLKQNNPWHERNGGEGQGPSTDEGQPVGASQGLESLTGDRHAGSQIQQADGSQNYNGGQGQ